MRKFVNRGWNFAPMPIVASAGIVVATLLSAPPIGAQVGAQDGPKKVDRAETMIALSSSMRDRAPLAQGNGRKPELPTNPLERPVSVSIKNAKLKDALKTLADSAHLKVTYGDAVAQSAIRVTLVVSKQSLGDALDKMLSGTQMAAQVLAPGELVIHPKAQTADSLATARFIVVDSSTQQAVGEVMITINPGNRRLLSAANGRIAAEGLAPGKYTVTLRRLGYSPRELSLQLTAGMDTTIAVRLVTMANVLSEVVTTGSGERAKVEVGNTITTIDVEEIMKSTPVSSVSDLLANRVPGMIVQGGSGAAGAPQRFRIRGSSSIEQDNGPLFIVDGVRVATYGQTAVSNTISQGVVGGAASGANDIGARIDDFDPHSIETIEVLRGPSASALYGADAANGVIIIKTKRGQVGPPRWTLSLDHREKVQASNYLYPVGRIGYSLTGAGSYPATCSLTQLRVGTCIPYEDELWGFNQLEDSRFSPVGRGYTQVINGSVSGGVSAMQYFFGGGYTNELGNARLPQVNADYIVNIGRGGIPLSKEVRRPSANTRTNANAKVTGQFMGNNHYTVGGDFISGTQRVGGDGMTALLDRASVRLPSDTTPIAGWDKWNEVRQNKTKHFRGYASANINPPWWGGQRFSGEVVYGLDYSVTDDEAYAPRNSCDPLCESQNRGINGYLNAGRRSNEVHSLDLRGTLNWDLTSRVGAQTVAGLRYNKTTLYELYGSANDLDFGRRFTGAGGTKNIMELGQERAGAGWTLDQRFFLRQRRLFVNASIGQDASSTLGDEVRPVFPRYNVSWVASEEPFFPSIKGLDLARLRFAYGQAGVSPGITARLRTWAMQTNGVCDNGVAECAFAELGGPGNPDIKPERGTEYEYGFDLELNNSQMIFEFTWWRKYTRDAIQRAPVAGSVGPGVTRFFMGNVGDVEGNGMDITANIRVVDREKMSYTLHGSYATSTGSILTRYSESMITFLEVNASGDLYTGEDSRVVLGYPLFGRWAYPILGWSDQNADGRIDPLEVAVGDSMVFMGRTDPKYTLNMGHTLGFFKNRLTINANFAYASGFTQFNEARLDARYYSLSGQGQGSLKEQACVAATVGVGSAGRGRYASDWCFMETVRVLRFQDLSVGYTFGESIARFVGASSASLRFTARNLHVWTNYKGIDPNVNTTPVTGNAVKDAGKFPAPREYGLSLRFYF